MGMSGRIGVERRKFAILAEDSQHFPGNSPDMPKAALQAALWLSCAYLPSHGELCTA
jgi:hypothetical protein